MSKFAFCVVAPLSVSVLIACSSSDEISTPQGSGGATLATTSGGTTGQGTTGDGTAAAVGGASSNVTTVGSTSSGGASSGQGGATLGGGQTTTTEGVGGSSAVVTTGVGGTAGTSGIVDTDRTPEAVCARWNADRADMSEGTWSGSVESCDPGDISEDGRANALRLYNLYRWLADLPPVETSPERNQLAQACALMMEANGQLSHSPGTDWTCYTEEGAEGASSSNISSGSSVRSVDGYMIDNGNATTIGHRRWILSNSLGPIGIGSTGNGASCMQNLRGEGAAGKQWQAWPAPGVLPYEAYSPNSRGTLGDTGWTLQSDELDLSAATVTLTSGGVELPVTVTQLQSGYGSRDAIRFNPDGWEAEAGETYSVVVNGVDAEIAYSVQLVQCSN